MTSVDYAGVLSRSFCTVNFRWLCKRREIWLNIYIHILIAVFMCALTVCWNVCASFHGLLSSSIFSSCTFHFISSIASVLVRTLARQTVASFIKLAPSGLVGCAQCVCINVQYFCLYYALVSLLNVCFYVLSCYQMLHVVIYKVKKLNWNEVYLFSCVQTVSCKL